MRGMDTVMENVADDKVFAFQPLIAQGTGAVILGLGLLLLVSMHPVDARAQATIEAVLSIKPFSKEDVADVKKGKTISTGLKAVPKRELAAGAACLIKGDASSRFWIDYWTGFPSLKHSVGQKVMSGEMEERIKRLEICR
jgi:hypothetical protein